MKKFLIFCILILSLSLLCACGESETASSSTQDMPLDARLSENSTSSSDTEIDYDLTKLSTTMVYASVYDMLIAPDTYIDKTVKITGEYYVYSDPTTGGIYHLVMITDATLCCQQGIEFVLIDGEYPTEGETITVVGSFNTYEELGYTYCELQNAAIV